MQASEYEKGLLVAASWQLSRNNDVNELLAVACCIRNWVVPRANVPREPMNGKLYFNTYSEAIRNFLSVYPVRELPEVNEPALIDPADGLLLKIDDVYSCSAVDVTSSRAFPGGARYFARPTCPNGWQLENVLITRQLIGAFGSQQFYV